MPNSKSAPCAVPVCPSSSRRVATHADFLEALDSFHADLIIADYNLPDIDGLTAVRLVRQRDSALPVLLVTGVLDDEAAAAVVKAGATDYVRKDRLARLPLAVEGALAAATTQRVLQQSQREIADLYNNAPCGYHSTTRDLTIVSMNDTELAWLGYRRDEVVGKLRIVDLLTPSSATKIVQEAFPRLLATGSVRDVELDMVCKDGAILPTLFSATSVTDPDGSFVRSRTTVYDTSRLKEAEQRERNLQPNWINPDGWRHSANSPPGSRTTLTTSCKGSWPTWNWWTTISGFPLRHSNMSLPRCASLSRPAS